MPSDADRARSLLAYANYAKVAGALLVSRATVADWAKGKSVTPYRLRQLEQLLRPDLDIAKAPPPDWARALQETVDSIHARQDTIMARQGAVADTATQKVIEALADPERLAWVERAVAAIRDESHRQSAEASDGPPASGAPGTAGPGGPASGSSLARDSEE